jgi:hypothetical protein
MAIAAAAAKMGIGVYAPLTVERCDLVFDLRPKLVRVQCKWAVRDGDVVVVRCTSRRGREGYVRTVYTPDEVDAIAAYCLELDRCYFLPIRECANRRAVQLRLAPTRNNQVLRVNWAEDFAFEATLRQRIDMGP